jgi:LL-diaminopimelate aminotransferase
MNVVHETLPFDTAGLPCPVVRRLSGLAPYVFAWLDELKAGARARGADLIDLGIGSPDQPTPEIILDTIATAYRDPACHGYPPFRGTPGFRDAVARFMARRFGVTVDPDSEVLCVSGAKEAVVQTTMAFVDEKGSAIVPEIFYPVHGRAAQLIGGRVDHIPLRAERDFLPDLAAIPADVLSRGRLLILNYPQNPTGAVAPLALYEHAVALCREHGLVLLSDLAYSELTYDGKVAPSALQVPGAREVTIELHSFSKSFNMAGSRIGFAVGGRALIDALYAVRTNVGYGTPAAIQAGAAVALDRASELTPPIAREYQRRRDVVVDGFRRLGWTVTPPGGTMFVWLPVPRGFSSQHWSRHLIDRADVVVTPGNAFGPGGEGYFRVGLVADVDRLTIALKRLGAAGVRYE